MRRQIKQGEARGGCEQISGANGARTVRDDRHRTTRRSEGKRPYWSQSPEKRLRWKWLCASLIQMIQWMYVRGRAEDDGRRSPPYHRGRRVRSGCQVPRVVKVRLRVYCNLPPPPRAPLADFCAVLLYCIAALRYCSRKDPKHYETWHMVSLQSAKGRFR